MRPSTVFAGAAAPVRWRRFAVAAISSRAPKICGRLSPAGESSPCRRRARGGLGTACAATSAHVRRGVDRRPPPHSPFPLASTAKPYRPPRPPQPVCSDARPPSAAHPAAIRRASTRPRCIRAPWTLCGSAPTSLGGPLASGRTSVAGRPMRQRPPRPRRRVEKKNRTYSSKFTLAQSEITFGVPQTLARSRLCSSSISAETPVARFFVQRNFGSAPLFLPFF